MVVIPGLTSKTTLSLTLKPWVEEVETVVVDLVTKPVILLL